MLWLSMKYCFQALNAVATAGNLSNASLSFPNQMVKMSKSSGGVSMWLEKALGIVMRSWEIKIFFLWTVVDVVRIFWRADESSIVWKIIVAWAFCLAAWDGIARFQWVSVNGCGSINLGSGAKQTCLHLYAAPSFIFLSLLWLWCHFFPCSQSKPYPDGIRCCSQQRLSIGHL